MSVRLPLALFLLFASPFWLWGQNEEKSLRVDLGGGLVMDLVMIEPGDFQQGSPDSEVGRNRDERARPVTLTRGFYLGKFPVTRGEFARFVNETHYRTEAEAGTSGGFGWDGEKLAQRKEFTWKNPGFAQTDEHPVTIVTYRDAHAFLDWLSRKTGRAFSLPTEAQWEYAARGSSRTAYPSGDDPKTLEAEAWFRENAGNGTHPVGQKALNAWGLGDMLGNVWEWCEDWYAMYPEGGAATDPKQTQSNLSDKPRRVLRGGSWLKDAAACRLASRYRNDPASRNADNGFRVMTFDRAPKSKPVSNPAVPANGLPKSAPSQPGSDRIEPVAPPKSSSVESSDGVSSSQMIVGGEVPVGGSSNGPGFFFLLLILAGGALAVFVLIRKVMGLARGFGGGGGGFSSFGGGSGPIQTRIVDDGFWVMSSQIPIGAVLDCRYIAGGQQGQSSVTYDGGSQGKFVFTGSRPSSVSVSVRPGSTSTMNPPLGGIGGIGGFGARPPYRGSGMSGGLADDEPPAFRGHPPAY